MLSYEISRIILKIVFNAAGYLALYGVNTHWILDKIWQKFKVIKESKKKNLIVVSILQKKNVNFKFEFNLNTVISKKF